MARDRPSRPTTAAAATKPAQVVFQVFGRKDSRETQKALRFFRERRQTVSFIDVAVRPPAPGELRRFAERFGAAALLDREGRLYREQGLGYLRMDDAQVLERIGADARLLRLPLVRYGARLSVGVDEHAWKGWLAGG